MLRRYHYIVKNEWNRLLWFYVLLHGALFVGLFQLGLTPAEWTARQSSARARGISTTELVRAEEGAWGLLRAYLRTDSDERLYREYANLAQTGHADFAYIAAKQFVKDTRPAPTEPAMPYRDVRIEYPPLALYLGMFPPALVAGDSYRGYRFALGAYAWLAYSLTLACAIALLRQSGTQLSAARLLLRSSLAFCLLLGNIVCTRIDVWVALSCLASVLSLERALASPAAASQCWACAAGVVVAAGALFKIAPGLLILSGTLVLASAALRGTRLCLTFASSALAVGVAGHALSLWLFGDGYLATFAYHAARGIQIESSYATGLLFAAWFGLPVSLEYSFGSSNLASTWSAPLAHAAPAVFFTCAALLLHAAYRWRVRDIALLSSALLTLFILTNKVFSPQYLIWIAPLVLVHVARTGDKAVLYVLLLAALLSQVIYPRAYSSLARFWPPLVAALILRNSLMLGLLVLMLRRLRATRARDGELSLDAAPSAA